MTSINTRKKTLEKEKEEERLIVIQSFVPLNTEKYFRIFLKHLNNLKKLNISNQPHTLDANFRVKSGRGASARQDYKLRRSLAFVRRKPIVTGKML